MRARRPPCAVLSVGAIGAIASGVAIIAFVAFGALCARGALGALDALRPFGAACAGGAGVAVVAFGPLGALLPGWPLGAGRATACATALDVEVAFELGFLLGVGLRDGLFLLAGAGVAEAEDVVVVLERLPGARGCGAEIEVLVGHGGPSRRA